MHTPSSEVTSNLHPGPPSALSSLDQTSGAELEPSLQEAGGIYLSMVSPSGWFVLVFPALAPLPRSVCSLSSFTMNMHTNVIRICR